MKTNFLATILCLFIAVAGFSQSVTQPTYTKKVVFILESDAKYTTPERMNYLFGKVQGIVKFEYQATLQQVTVEYNPEVTQPVVIEKQVEVKPYQFRWEPVKE